MRVDLNVRGICCERPGIRGDLREHPRRLDRRAPAQHSRVYAFERDGEYTIYISSADLMPRNLDHRVELAGADRIAGTAHRAARHAGTRVRGQPELVGSSTARASGSDGAPGPGEAPRNLQLELAELHARRAGEGGTGRRAGSGDAAQPLSVRTSGAPGASPRQTRTTPAASSLSLSLNRRWR